MATSNSERAADALDALATIGVPFAILHGSRALESAGATSDVDLVVANPASSLVPGFSAALRERGLHTIVQWNYDVGGATTLILSTHDAGDGVQVDLLHDVNGVGIDGIMTPHIIRQRESGGGWPRADPVHETLYLIRKRARKENDAAVHELVERGMREHSRDVLRREAFKIFRAPVARSVCELLDGARVKPVGQPAAVCSRTTRWARRLAQPAGFWAECGTSVAHDVDVRTVAGAFARFMPYSRAEQRPHAALATWRWFAQDVAPIRWRPGLVVSSGSEPTRLGPRPDLVVERASSAAEVQTMIVAAMERRVLHSSHAWHRGVRGS